MSNLNFDSNKIKKKWKELYTEKDKIISFINNFDRSNSKFSNKIYIEESRKKQNIEKDLSSTEDIITDTSKVAVKEDSEYQEINQEKESESKINDQEEIIPIEPKYNLEQVETLNTNIPNSELKIINGCSHNAHLEEPDKINQIIDKFLSN